MPSNASWSPPRAKVQLKLSIQRLRLLASKKTQLAKTTRRDIAAQLERGKIESARIKVEQVLGEDTMVELLEVLELYCELLLARFGLLEGVKDVDPGVAEAVIGIIHAAPRTELKELHTLRDMLISKGGRDFAIDAIDNVDNCVPERISSKLIIAQPPSDLVDLYLYEIAKAYSIDWKPESVLLAEAAAEPSASPTPTPIALPTPASPAKAPLPPFDTPSLLSQPPTVSPSEADHTVILKSSLPSPGLVAPAAPLAPAPASTPKEHEKVDQSKQASAGAKEKDEDAFEALSRRFAELKKR